MATTPNFGWETPDDTDYVKDGAAAMRTLGNAIDASLMDLEGGTTGQVLSKNSNTDMDFVWVTPNDADAIQNTIVDAKGDLITATAADTPARLAVGTNGQLLVADSTTATGLKWADPAGGGSLDFVALNPGGTAVTGLSTVTISFAAQKALMIVFSCRSAVQNNTLYMRFNGDSGNNYTGWGLLSKGDGTFQTGVGGTQFYMGTYSNWDINYWISFTALMFGADRTGRKPITWTGNADSPYATGQASSAVANYAGASAITSVTLYLSSGTWNAGSVSVFGAA